MRTIIIILALFLATPCFGQALDINEKAYAEVFLKYYSGELPKLPKDEAKIEGYIYGDDPTKRAFLKTFIKDIILPSAKLSKNQIEASLTRATNKVTELEDYIKP